MDRRTRRILVPASGLLGVLLLAAAARFTVIDDWGLRTFRETVQGLGAWAPVAFVVLFAALVTLYVPPLPLAITGGLLFPLPWSLVWVWGGLVVGAHGGYLLGRAAGGPLERFVRRHATAVLGDHDEERAATVALLRAVPLVPFAATNTALGSARIPLPAYTAGTAVGLLPNAVAHTLAGAVLAGGAPAGSATFWLLLGAAVVALAAAVALAWLLHDRLRGRLPGLFEDRG